MATRNAEEEIYHLCSITKDVTKINIERGNEFVVNSRSEKLYVRTHWPEDVKPKAIVISLHGYASHASRPTHKYISSQFIEKGLGYVCLDFHGHGYSDGMRGLVTSAENLIDDVICLLKALYSKNLPGTQEGKSEGEDTFNLKVYPGNVPFFLSGQSMGGAVALTVGHLMRRTMNGQNAAGIDRLTAYNFRGCLFLCPAINIKLPHPIVVTLLNYLIVPLFGHSSIPEFIQPSNTNHGDIWKDEHFINYVASDGYPLNPNGLSFCQAIRFQTGSNILKLSTRCKEELSEIDYPFIIFHDPQDRVVSFEGAQKLLEVSKTKTIEKECVLIKGGLHDLTSNETTFITQKSLEWIESQLTAKTEPDSST